MTALSFITQRNEMKRSSTAKRTQTNSFTPVTWKFKHLNFFSVVKFANTINTGNFRNTFHFQLVFEKNTFPFYVSLLPFSHLRVG